ncbi:EAL domain-containing protein [uncultured Hyphomonas sp.]|jgi:EAL domain-containing protein (putative c-di-GMP-specific phosphodiesterase class I)|uniref:EAL domain-containing protein n=1 Tax=uncultured Hyphomonas sp. TaxID=225298 RepID=UPI0030D8842F|tara:strand:+ start:374847 stop:375875 length:1029 start_codon:yes stop_codon:yes gene_type:complete
MMSDQSTQPQGSWHWNAVSRHLLIEAPKGGDLSDLAGQWSIDAIEQMFEGLSRGRLAQAFSTSEGPVRCDLRLSSGADIHLVGAFVGEEDAHGMLLAGNEFADIDPSDLQPGPDLYPVFQPIISLGSGRIAGFEALARWDDGELRNPPSRYEDEALASNMLIRSAETLSKMRELSGRSDLFMHVNLTARDLARSTLPALVEALMQGYDLPEKALRIELTEQAALRDESHALAAVMALKAVGAGLVLDDFGTGHSSFAWLADFPADSLKVDHGLTRRLGQHRTDTILGTLTLLAARLDMTTTAEGVEHKDDATKLRSLGFDYAQGFAFARPMEEAAALAFLTA